MRSSAARWVASGGAAEKSKRAAPCARVEAEGHAQSRKCRPKRIEGTKSNARAWGGDEWRARRATYLREPSDAASKFVVRSSPAA